MPGKKSQRKQQQQHHLLHIPGEIRNQIYSRLLLSSHHAIPIFRSGDNKLEATEEVLSTLTALLLTCRQIHHEAGSLFYSRARFALPPDASHAPHQAQVNLLFRAFLDRIGPRNAALIRHLTIPFPVDPDLFLQRTSLLSRRRWRPPPRGGGEGGHEAGREPVSGQEADEQQREKDWGFCDSSDEVVDYYSDDEDADADPAVLLISALRERCPALETVTFDLRWTGSWARRLLQLLNLMAAAMMRKRMETATTAMTRTTRKKAAAVAAQTAAVRLFGPVDALLRAAFPRLKRVDLLLGVGGYRGIRADPITSDEAALLREWLGNDEEEEERKEKKKRKLVTVKDVPRLGCKWDVTIVEERETEVAGRGWNHNCTYWWWGMGTWYGPPRKPRHAFEMLYSRPASAIRLEMQDDGKVLDVVWAHLRLAAAWLRSPTRAVLDREEAIEWKRWRRAMLANAFPRGALSLKSLRVGGGGGGGGGGSGGGGSSSGVVEPGLAGA
ncbi:hypothetical protein VTH82DRAFT_438 [Thermothelomyces myriococcoides]